MLLSVESFVYLGRGTHVVLCSFFGLFSTFIYRLVNNVGAVRIATEQTLRDFEEDGVVHFELRTTPRAFAQTSTFYLVPR